MSWNVFVVADLLCKECFACCALQYVCDTYSSAVARSSSAQCALEWATKSKLVRIWLRRACKRGDLRMVKWLFRMFEIDFDVDVRADEYVDSPFEIACEYGHLETARWMANHFPWSHAEYCEAFWSACSCKDGPEAARWLYSRCQFSRDEIITTALDYVCGSGHSETLMFLHETFGCRRTDFDDKVLFNTVIKHSDGDPNGLALLRWIHKRFPFERTNVLGPVTLSDGATSAFDLICSFGTFDAVKWIFEKFDVTRDEIAVRGWRWFSSACSNENPSVAKWVWKCYLLTYEELGDERLAKAFSRAYSHASADIAIWLIDKFDRFPHHVYDSLISSLTEEDLAIADVIVRRFGSGFISEFSFSIYRGATVTMLQWADANLPVFGTRGPADLLRVAHDLDTINWVVKRFGAAAFDRETIEARLNVVSDLDIVKRLMSLPMAPPAYPNDSMTWRSLEIQQWLDTTQGIAPNFHIFEKNCIYADSDDLIKLEWMRDRAGISKDDVQSNAMLVSICLGTGDLEIVCWFVNMFEIKRANLLNDDGGSCGFCEAIIRENLRVVRWLYRRFNLADARDHVAANARVMDALADNLHNRTTRWVYETYDLRND